MNRWPQVADEKTDEKQSQCSFYTVKNQKLPRHVQLPDRVRSQLLPEYWTWTRDGHFKLQSIDACIYDSVIQFHPMVALGTAAARGTRKLINDTIAYWEIHVFNAFGTSMMFGIGQKNAKMMQPVFFEDMLGLNELSMGINHKGNIQRNGTKTPYMRPFADEGLTRIGLLFDGPEKTLSYYHNGMYCGVAFSDIDTTVPWYPMVSSTAQKSIFKAELCFSNAHKHIRVPKSLLHCAMDVVDKNNVNMPIDFNIPSVVRHKVDECRLEHNYCDQQTFLNCGNSNCHCQIGSLQEQLDSYNTFLRKTTV